MEETLKKIDKAQATLSETKTTISSIDDTYDKIQKMWSDTIDQAVSNIEKTTILTVAEPGF